MAQQQGFLGLMDMFDGGGAGASGSQFKGGPVSGLLNSLGINPYGTQAKMQGMQDTRPQARPPMPGQSAPAQQQPAQRPPAMPQQQPMQYGPQNGRGAAGPAPVGQSGPQPMPTDQQRMQYGPQQPKQYSGRGQTGMPLPPGLELSPEEQRIVEFLRSTQDSPY